MGGPRLVGMTDVEKREYTLQRQAIWRAENKEHSRERDRLYRLAHMEEEAQRQARFRAGNPEKVALAQKRYRQSHPERLNSKNGQRRAIQNNAPLNDFDSFDWMELLVQWDERCAYCGQKGLKLEREHMIPLSRGGSHTKGNIVPSCQPCNVKKGTKTVDEYR